jgi:hypothetical protein
MTPKVIIVMLIWAGAPPVGSPATIAGFLTVEACEHAIPSVMDAYKKNPASAEAVAKCISLEAGQPSSNGTVRRATPH